MRVDETERGHTRIGALDGLRGLAVAAVLLYHSQFGWARGGFLGVSAFFTLSGYLITSLLLTRQREAGGIGLGAFWARRARRLLPAAALALAGVLLFAATVATTDQLRTLRGDVIATLGYVANWRFYYSGQSYARLFSAPSPVLHFWSLAIEEQFYLVFPLVVVFVAWAGHGRRRVLGAVIGAGIVASVVASRALYSSVGASRVYYGTDTRAAELLIGALLAVIVSGRVTGRPRITARGRMIASAAGVAALGLMTWWWATVSQTDAWLYRGGLALHACCAVTVIAVVRFDGPLSRALSWRPLAGLGRISYGVYLFHWPIFLWLSADRTGLATFPLFALRVAITLALAIASFVWIERPILRATLLRGAGPKFAIPATAAALVTVLVLVTSSLPPPTIVFAPLSARPSALHTGETPFTPPATTAPAPATVRLFRPLAKPRPLRILVVGDSVGQTLGRGLELWARQTGDAIVLNTATPTCSLGRHLLRKLPLGEEVAPDANCEDWDRKWPQTIASFDPDVVVVLYSIWEVEQRKLPSGRWAKPGDPEFDRWQLSEYRAASDILSARGAPVLWLNIACEDTAIELRQGFWYLDEQTIPKLAASRPSVHVVDMNSLLCPNGSPDPDFGGVRDIRPDGAHYSDAGALAVAHWLMPIVLGEQPAPPRIFPRN
jgi:peptidoglycan/LPS O-acetylase OafA/YrhL